MRKLDAGTVEKPKRPDDRAGAHGPGLPQQPQQPTRPDDRGGVRGPGLPHTGLGKPIPVLQSHGFGGDIQEFNDRVQRVHDAHVRTFGYKPSPGLVLAAAATGAIAGQELDKLFDTPRNPRLAKIAAGAQALGRTTDNVTVKQEEDQFLRQYVSAKAQGTAQKLAFLHDNDDQLREYMKDDDFKVKFAGAFLRGERQQAVTAEAMVTPSIIKSIFDKAGLSVAQVAQALVYGPPTLVYAEGKAAYHDAGDVAHGKLPKHLIETNKKIAVESAKGVVRDFRHPLANPGFLALDAFGLISFGAGTAVRVTAAGRAAAAGESITRALITRPRGGRATLRKGKIEEDIILTENQAVNLLQRLIVKRRNKRMDLRHEGTDNPYPSAVYSAVRSERAQDGLDRMLDPIRAHFSSERKLGREAEARMKVEEIADLTIAREFDHVAGWTGRASQVFGRLPQRLRRGLTQGEQKALWVLATDDEAPLQLWRDFHRKMIAWDIGSAKAHRAHLGLLDLAEKVLENPSKRFEKSIKLAREVSEEQTRMKIEELGLAPDTAERRVIMPAEIARRATTSRSKEQMFGEIDAISPERLGEVQGRINALEKEIARAPAAKFQALDDELRDLHDVRDSITAEMDNLTRRKEDSFYIPSITRGKPSRRAKRGGDNTVRVSPYGYTRPAELSELKHFFTGDSLMWGDIRLDTSTLIGDAYARTVRATAVLSAWKRLWEAGLEKPVPGPDARFYRPIRDARVVSDELRKVIDQADEGVLTGEDMASLSKKQVEDIHKALYPGEFNKKTGRWQLATDDLANVRWVDERVVGEHFRMPVGTAAKKIGQGLNEPFRITTLFLRPAYILNALGNGGMGVLHQGWTYPANSYRAIKATSLYGEKVTHTLDALVGEGRASSYVGEIDSIVTKGGRALAHGWSLVADRLFRRAALIYELRRLGYKTKEDFERVLFDEGVQKDLIEAKRRANKAMVEFDNLTWFEKQVVRHWIFVYPWVSRSLVWSLRTIVEHPVASDLLAQVGHETELEQPEIFKHVPEWFARTGYVPVGFHKDGSPVVVNPTSVNSFSTVGEMVTTAEATFFKDTPYSSAGDLLGPGARLFMHTVTGRDEFGNEYPGADFAGAFKEVITGLPQIAAQRKANRENPQLKGIDLSDIRTLIERQNSALKRSVFGPGWMGGYGRLFAGGLSPTDMDPAAAAARYWAKQPAEVRHKHEMQLIRKALQLQQQFMRKTPSSAVRDAIDLSGERQWQRDLFAKEQGRTPSQSERVLLDINVLEKARRVGDQDAALLRDKLAKLTDPSDVAHFQQGILDKYAGAKELKTWNKDVNFLWSFRKHILGPKVALLRFEGLAQADATAVDQADLFEYGRRNLAYVHEARKRREEMKSLSGDEKTVAMAQLRAWDEQNDKPVTVNGVTLPSPVRMQWAYLRIDQRVKIVDENANSRWQNLSSFDKELLGRKPAAGISEAYARLEQAKAEYRATYKGAKITRDQLLAVVKQLDKFYPGFKQDYAFGQQAKINRFVLLKPFKQMPAEDRSKFDSAIGTNARVIATALASGNYENSVLTATWKDYVKNSLKPWLDQPEQASLKKELDAFGNDFLNSLVSR